MEDGYMLYGARGSGSVAVEATFALFGLAHEGLDLALLTDPAADDRRPGATSPIKQRIEERLTGCWAIMKAQIDTGRRFPFNPGWES